MVINTEKINALLEKTIEHFYQTQCQECKKSKTGNRDNYIAEMRRPDSQWACLVCGARGFVFDDEYHERIQDLRELLGLLNDVMSVEWTDGKQSEVASKIERFFNQKVSDILDQIGWEE